MYKTNNRKKPNQGHVKRRFNHVVNKTKKANRTINQRGGITL